GRSGRFQPNRGIIMIVLGMHTGHDAGAAVFKAGQLISFCNEERVTRVTSDGGFFALASIDEALGAVGVTRNDVDDIALTRTRIPEQVFAKTSHPIQTLKRKVLPTHNRDLNLAAQMRKTGLDEATLIDLGELRKALKVDPQTDIYFP